ncbi:unnamed protein product [Oncorhynchus mykiss]|uniref:Uncharacterized protein n=1 Tax=Oncorhynchus mykiss TaxID=8022 RepID=A0A060WUC0_ONCMY|nr:unnamed protein product [Oncorhynchus mykiss]
MPLTTDLGSDTPNPNLTKVKPINRLECVCVCVCYRDPWQDVEGCVRISAQHCDVSQAFSDFELYNMIRLGLHQGPGSPVWTKPRKFDPSDFTFNSPSISVSLSRERLVVEVHFPCSTNRGCFPLQSCCPLSELIDPWVTVTVYNQHNHSDYKVSPCLCHLQYHLLFTLHLLSFFLSLSLSHTHGPSLSPAAM